MPEYLFVYGTLCPGRPNEHILKNIGGEFVPATIRGTLHEKGWGATMGYPAIKLDPKGPTVSGYVFSSEQLHLHWRELDEFEGEAYQRTNTAVTLDSGEQINAWVYTLHPSLNDHTSP